MLLRDLDLVRYLDLYKLSASDKRLELGLKLSSPDFDLDPCFDQDDDDAIVLGRLDLELDDDDVVDELEDFLLLRPFSLDVLDFLLGEDEELEDDELLL